MKKLFVCAFLLVLFVCACAPAATATSAPTEVVTVPVVSEPTQIVEPTATSATVAITAVFQVVKADSTRFDVTLDDIKKLKFANITEDGKVQEGPKLLDILTLAGVTDFTEVTLTGSASPVTLTRAQVDDNTILDLNNHGRLKLATTYVPMPDWTKDISEITVK